MEKGFTNVFLLCAWYNCCNRRRKYRRPDRCAGKYKTARGDFSSRPEAADRAWVGIGGFGLRDSERRRRRRPRAASIWFRGTHGGGDFDVKYAAKLPGKKLSPSILEMGFNVTVAKFFSRSRSQCRYISLLRSIGGHGLEGQKAKGRSVRGRAFFRCPGGEQLFTARWLDKCKNFWPPL